MPIRDNDPRTAYEQLADEVRQAIAAGELTPGDRLPSIAALAETHQVAPMTVRRALRLLEDQRLVIARQGRGVFVLDPPEPAPEPAPEPLVAVRESLYKTIGLLEKINQRLDRHEEAQRQGPGRQAEPDTDHGRTRGAAAERPSVLDEAMEDLRVANAALDEALARQAAEPGIDDDLGPIAPEPDRGPDLSF